MITLERKQINWVTALLLSWLTLSATAGCNGEDESTASTAGGAEVTQAGAMTTGEVDQGGAGQEASMEDDTELNAGTQDTVPEGGAPEGEGPEGGATGGGEVLIDVAGTEVEEETYDPIDESVPGEGIHAFSMTNIDGEVVDMRRYRNRVVLVVNVASQCGYTGQYDGLQELYSTYKDRGLVILGFPANNFGSQEPGSDEEISEFCESRFGVTFPMFSKISVAGDDIHPLYAYLTEQSGREVSWNFNKFLVGPDGLYQEQYLSPTAPLSAELTGAIETLLEALNGE